METLLTNEEIEDIWEQSQGCPHKEMRMGEVIAKAQDAKTRKVMAGAIRAKTDNYADAIGVCAGLDIAADMLEEGLETDTDKADKFGKS